MMANKWSHTLALLAVGLFATWPLAVVGQTNVTTQHNDIGRTGQNLTETSLTPANVSGGGFGRLYSVNLDGRVFAQPLYLSSILIGGAGHSVVYVATTHDSVYALDANANGAVLWHASLLDSAHGAATGAIPDPESDTGCGDVDNTEYGVMGTPVIDTVSGTLYVVSLTYEGNYPVQRLHALNVTTGAEQSGSPVVIQASVAGTGAASSNGVIAFDPKWENQRAGLLLVNGTVYIGWGSHCDNGPWHGWLLGYNATTLKQTYVFMSSPNGDASGIWLSGVGLAADDIVGSNGSTNPRLFTATGNGSFDSNGDWGESLLNLNLAPGAAQAVTDSFTPSNQAQLTNDDEDLGAAGPILLPDSAGTTQHPHLAVQLSKAGVLYLLDRDHLGGYNGTADNDLQDVTFGSFELGIWGGPAFFNNNIYFWAADGNMQQYSLTNGVLSSTPTAVNSILAPGTGGGYYEGTFLGATPSISANGGNNGIVWVDDAVRDQGDPIQYLYAFSAANVQQTLWSSNQVPSRDGAGGSQKFAVPTIADGKVFLAGQNLLNVYGILPAGFLLATSDAAFTVVPGTSITTTVAVNGYSGFSGAVAFTVSGMPSGVTARFSPAASATSTTLTLTAAANAPAATAGAITITGTSGSISQTLPLQVSVANGATPVQVNLSNAYTGYGSSNVGTAPLDGGFDGTGYAYAANLLGSSISALGVTFAIAPAGSPTFMTSEQVSLPAGQYTTLNFLAASAGGYTGSQNQTFIVNYTDGTTSTFTQSISNWGAPQNYAGETIALQMSYRLLPNGAKDTSGAYYVYAYSFTLNSSKVVQSISLPPNPYVNVLAITLSGEGTQGSISLAASANVYSSFSLGSAPTNGGFDGANYAYSTALLGNSLTVGGVQFNLGASGTPNAVSNAVVPLTTTGTFNTLNVLAAAAFGNQSNSTFLVTYTDGSTTTFTQGVSDWGSPQGYPGETYAISMPGRVAPGGVADNSHPFNVYAYAFSLNPAKTVKSVTLPASRSVVVLAITLSATPPTSVQGPVVGLAPFANVYATANDGTPPLGTGLDNSLYAFSANLLGPAVSWNGISFPIVGPTMANAVSAGTIPLPVGQYGQLDLLATATGAGANQTLVVTYTDGTTSTFTQGMSNWGAPQNYSGESIAVTMAHRVVPNGSTQSYPWNLYGYSFALNVNKSVQSVTLPNTRGVVVLGTAVAQPVPIINLSSVANVYGSSSNGTLPVDGGLDGSGYAYSTNVLGTSVTWNGLPFPVIEGTANGVWGATVSLPSGKFSSINVLATSVGNTTNQTFVVTYTDGTTSTFTQSISNWGAPQSYTGESTALSMPYRVLPSGATQNGPWYLYGYTFALNPQKTVQSITLPNNRSVVVMSMAFPGT